MYKPYHLIGLELNISILSAALRNEPTGQPHGFRGDVAAVAKRDLRAGEMLDGEGGYTVWGKLMPAAASLAAGALPIGLAHRVKLKNDVAHGAVVRWSDVEVDANNDTIKTRKAMEAAFAIAALALRQQTARSRVAEPFAEHRLGIHHLGKAGLVDLHGRDDRRRPRLGLAIAHAVVGILERQADERLRARAKSDRACGAARPTARSISDIPAPATAAPALPGFMSSASAIAGQTFSQVKTSPLVTLKASLRAAAASPAQAIARASRSTSTACDTRAAPPG